jgi:hypothetical protein
MIVDTKIMMTPTLRGTQKQQVSFSEYMIENFSFRSLYQELAD